MSEIKLNQEMICALQNCKDAKEIMAFAKSKGVELSEEKAEKIYAVLQDCTLSDEELDMVRGGNNTTPEFLGNTDWNQVFNWINNFNKYIFG